MTIICGGEVKSLTGTGMRFTMYSHTASTLYFSWAEMGTTGALSAMVPLMNSWMASFWFCAALSLHQNTVHQLLLLLHRGMCDEIRPLSACSSTKQKPDDREVARLRALLRAPHEVCCVAREASPDQIYLILQDDDVLQSA